MRPGRLFAFLLVAVLAAGCADLLTGGWDFPSPTRELIQAGRTTKADLLRFFGEPYQVGIDTGDVTWRWFYFKKHTQGELTKDLTVWFDAKGLVKRYSFSSNLPEDMARFK